MYYHHNKLYDGRSTGRQSRFHLIPYFRIKSIIPQLLSNWFTVCREKKARACIILLLRVICERPTANEATLLDVVKALEVFHRNNLNRSRIEKSEFKVRKEAIIKLLNDQDRDFFPESLRHANDLNLRARIIDLIEKYLGNDEAIVTN